MICVPGVCFRPSRMLAYYISRRTHEIGICIALGADDELKLVITDRTDYEWARDLVRGGRLPVGIPVTFSPGWGGLELRDLAGWILDDRLPVRFQVQIHKVVWPEAEGGV